MPRLRSVQLAVRLAFKVAVTAVLILTLLPLPDVPGLLGNDKLQHGAAFMALAMLGSFGWPGQAPSIALGLLFFGALVEGVQGFPMVGRDRSLLDLAADAVGIVTGLALAWFARGLRG